MPTYGYRCQSCDSEFEVWQSMSDPAVAACPSCQGAGKRQFYPAGILFKGSGFYKTDSRSSKTAVVSDSDGASNGSSAAATTESGGTGSAAPGNGRTDSGKAGGGAGSPASKPAATGNTKAAPTPAPSSD